MLRRPLLIFHNKDIPDNNNKKQVSSISVFNQYIPAGKREVLDLALFNTPDRKHYTQFPPDQLKMMAQAIIQAQAGFDWNGYNMQQFRGLARGETPLFPPLTPKVPQPFRSWLEVSLFFGGALSHMEFEPKDYIVKYVVEHNYHPDGVDPLNDRIFYESKGSFKDLASASKYRTIANQNNVHFVFVFQVKNLRCPWRPVRKDGTYLTHEEWCVKNKFDFCHLGEEDQFFNSPRYKWLIANFGKGKPTLKEQLAAKAKK